MPRGRAGGWLPPVLLERCMFVGALKVPPGEPLLGLRTALKFELLNFEPPEPAGGLLAPR